jgi:uncharacterized small protein (TIGR04563 family)
MSEKLEQALYFPETMLDALKETGARLDRSLSWCAQKAWTLSRATFSKAPSAVEGAEALPTSPELAAAREQLQARYSSDGAKRKQTLFFPEEMLAEMKAEAARLDRSLSWLVQTAWCIAEGEIKRLGPDSAGTS